MTTMSSFEIRNTKNMGQGLFSLVHFPANQVLLSFKGSILNGKLVDQLPANKAALLLQIGLDNYLDLNGTSEIFIKHNCNANAFVKIFGSAAFLVSTRDILPGGELTFDYSITSNDTLETWSMKCNCLQWNCRGTISGFGLLSDKDKEKYLKLDMVPGYIKKL